MMDYRTQIHSVFAGRAFERPLFYSFGGGLRFGLSASGTAIQQFLLAMERASEICRNVFDGDEVTVCLRFWSRGRRFAHRKMLLELHDASISIPRERHIWLDEVPHDDDDDDDDGVSGDGRLERRERQSWVCIAFKAPTSLLPNLLWCALSSDLQIRPRPRCLIYLFNLEKRLAAFPYDDRGMDVVGPNHSALKQLYGRHGKYLLEHDRQRMDATFRTKDPQR
jgi:hypothetical protein